MPKMRATIEAEMQPSQYSRTYHKLEMQAEAVYWEDEARQMRELFEWVSRPNEP